MISDHISVIPFYESFIRKVDCKYKPLNRKPVIYLNHSDKSLLFYVGIPVEFRQIRPNIGGLNDPLIGY